MRILITGGTGLIGRALAASLVADGHQAIALTRDPSRATALPPGVRAAGWDGRTAQGWAALADGAHGIVNLAGATISTRWTANSKRLIRDSRLNAGRAVVEAVDLARNRPHVVVQSSGAGYYGPRGDEEITEDAPPGSDFLGQLAVEWEASTAAVEDLGLRRVIVRSGVVLSADGGALPRMALPFRLYAGGPLGSGRQWLPWIHITDEVAAIRFALDEEAASGPLNLAAPNPLTNAGFSRALGRVLRRPAAFRVPAFALRLLLGDMATVLLDGQRAVPRKLQRLGFTFRFPEAEPALRDLLRPA